MNFKKIIFKIECIQKYGTKGSNIKKQNIKEYGVKDSDDITKHDTVEENSNKEI